MRQRKTECTHERRRQSSNERVARIGRSAGRAMFICHIRASAPTFKARANPGTPIENQVAVVENFVEPSAPAPLVVVSQSVSPS